MNVLIIYYLYTYYLQFTQKYHIITTRIVTDFEIAI